MSKLERLCHGLFQSDLSVSVSAGLPHCVFLLPGHPREERCADPVQPDLLRVGRAGLSASNDRLRRGQLVLRPAHRAQAEKDFSDSCAGIGSRLSGGIQIRGLFRGESERGFRRVHPRPADRAAHRHLLLYLSGAFLYGRRLARRCSGAALVCKAPALHLALPAADRRAYRPLFGCRRTDRRPAV